MSTEIILALTKRNKLKYIYVRVGKDQYLRIGFFRKKYVNKIKEKRLIYMNLPVPPDIFISLPSWDFSLKWKVLAFIEDVVYWIRETFDSEIPYEQVFEDEEFSPNRRTEAEK